ncbi:MAG TPA: Gfo/Idh/MocA family oxidoreductase, partial [Armatimonadetes bacterium]|nr:Gfo/Idh/MocA family oxidoreductase [Armatimonadota bacterium]
MSDKLRIGLVGCGGIAGAHLSAYQNSGLAQVVAVSDIDEAKAAGLAAKAEATAYTSYMEMIEK